MMIDLIRSMKLRRNPFVNQVSFFAYIERKKAEYGFPGRNPFVNQVSFFLIERIRKKNRWTLRKSGQFL